jgi:hypothetical protein
MRLVLTALLLIGLVLAPRVALPQTSSSYDPTSSQDGDDLDTILVMLGAFAAAIGGTSPLWGPVWVLNDDYGRTAYFYEHPYDCQFPGYLHLGDAPPPGTSVWAATLSSEYGFESDADRFGDRLTIDTSSRFGLDAEWNWISGDAAAFADPEFQTGDFNFTLRFAQDPHVQFRTGVGFRWLADDLDTNYGVSFMYGVDVEPIRPLVLSALIEGGALRHDPFFHGRASVGLIWSHVEVFAGFDYLQIDDQEIAGPMIGLKLWL